ncbi:Ig-like domain-containing protein [Gracilibacillus caseinilyticus]|uniref:Ig-like domain-containing protein n=1 Tax=Gracilibacillus caseinilyticus TaxID=2932256 RepID=A0ABY4ERM3_9BACI|nr:Ig-like domain-containing protein [Gracilibacillus caseinilyticus]UOQ46625.1 Ig-like domain-containing protein [Gracilibacillus caseinilyticus]
MKNNKHYRWLIAVIFVMIMSSVTTETVNAQADVLAFPGAEGGGKYTSGGRGYDVYEVTTTEDYGEGEAAISGSLRDAVSEDNRMIIFRVSGTIQLEQPLNIARKNITIAGQTAPGDGITVSGYGTNISNSENIIIRYMRFRPGSTNLHTEFDAFGGRDIKNAMIDHVSASWGIDEAFSFYRNENTTVQWSVISESLLISGHTKGRHGYGGIWGGENATFVNNLLATHISRVPALGNTGNELHPVSHADIVNNVIYNWGFNSTYGGENQKNNIMNNFYKPGPATYDNVSQRIISPGRDGQPGWFYIADNVMAGNKEVTENNMLGVEDIKEDVTFGEEPYPVAGHDQLAIRSAETAYQEVLDKAGATLPKRDPVDARVVRDVRNGTGRIINNEWEVGGFPEMKSAEAPVDSDHDGMPDKWEKDKGLNPDNSEDGKAITSSGYSNLELYLNSLADMDHEAANPDGVLASPRAHSVHKAGKDIHFNVNLENKQDIVSVEYYRNDQKIGEGTGRSFGFTWEDAPNGTWYVSAKITDKDGNATQTTSAPIYVNTMPQSGEWKSKDVGAVEVKGNASIENDQLTVKGTGRIIDDKDAFQFVYQQLMGDGTLTARISDVTKLNNNAISGLMIRDGLSPDAKTAMISTSVVKADRQDTLFAVHFSSRSEKGGTIVAPGEHDRPEENGVPSLLNTSIPYWLKIERVGDSLTGYASADGENWVEVGSKEINMKKKVYIGFAVDGAKNPNELIHYTTATFSDITLEEE